MLPGPTRANTTATRDIDASPDLAETRSQREAARNGEAASPSSKSVALTGPIDLKHLQVMPAVLKFIPEVLARRHRAIPVAYEDGILLVAMSNPGNLQAVQDLQTHTGVRLQVVQAAPEDMDAALELYYKPTSDLVKELEDYAVIGDGETVSSESDDGLLSTPVMRTLDLLLSQAVRDRASDIHIEPQPDRLRVRYRIDGVLHEVATLPRAVQASLVSRAKILARMNIAERRVPQDGQFTFKAFGKTVDVRVASIETAFGERVVMRVLDKTTSLMALSELGFLPEALAQYEASLRMPYGLILVSGPTGSGKTTTLYASLNGMDRVSRNILTVEDPIEYKFPNINQIQVNEVTFAAGLRSLMRHDPDVILVGEIRDQETAQTAVQAALTGHLVLSSIHANDTEGVIYRLINLGVEPFLVASALTGVVAQRMVRRVCTECGSSRPGSPEERATHQGRHGPAVPRWVDQSPARAHHLCRSPAKPLQRQIEIHGNYELQIYRASR
ncbi:MAG: type secretion system protein (GspE) [Dehalococcoidia bacterium]|nr:type secretion system protein (GspE) [Dehalococcoidia bacterium]